MTAKVLVIEDDEATGDVVKHALGRNGYEVTLCRDGESGFFQSVTGSFNLVILDVVLPERSGLEILAALRKLDDHIPVLMLSVRDQVEDRVAGLSLDADDYLGKPFAVAELLARVKVLLRRGKAEVVTRLSFKDLHIDLTTREVVRAGRPIRLTLKEFEILEYLMRHARRTVSRQMLEHDVWKDVNRATPLYNVIDVHVSRLRKKIDGPGQIPLLHTVRGIGFQLSDQPVDDSQPVRG